MTVLTETKVVRLGLPKGRMQKGIERLLADAGVQLSVGPRDYRPTCSLPSFDVKVLKPQNVVEMLAVGSRDVGFAGADWVSELEVDVVELLDTTLDPVRLVAAAPTELLIGDRLPTRSLIVASEYENLTQRWIAQTGLNARFIPSYGATEVFPPEDADCIVDNTATGATLRANGLTIVDDLMISSTRLYANPRVLEDSDRAERIENLVILLKSVLEARRRVMIEVNVPGDRLEALIEILPCMREPTVSPLHGGGGYAVKAAVLRELLTRVVPELKARGGTDIVVTQTAQIVP